MRAHFLALWVTGPLFMIIMSLAVRWLEVPIAVSVGLLSWALMTRWTARRLARRR